MRSAQWIRKGAGVLGLAWVVYAVVVLLGDCPSAGRVCEGYNVLLVAGGVPLAILVVGNGVAMALEYFGRHRPA